MREVTEMHVDVGRPAVYRQRGLHTGYRYQDLIAAVSACQLLQAGDGTLLIETGRFKGDPFDDIVRRVDGVRVQVKHAEGREPLPDDVLLTGANRLAIDALVSAQGGRPPRKSEAGVDVVAAGPDVPVACKG